MSIAAWAWPVIAVAGAVGALCRFTLDGAVEARSPYRFPFGTLCVNLLGAAILGVLYGLGTGGSTSLLIASAGIGTFTTFSTLVLETERLLEDGSRRLACANLLGSMGLGIVFVTLGWLLGRAL